MPMLSYKEKCFKAQTITLEELVPPNHFYRALEAHLDLSFVYELVKDTYASALGRPSIDPVVFFKLQLIMFFEGIRSERQLMATVNVNLAHRWYLGYDLNEPVPDHSSLSKIRWLAMPTERYGLKVFQHFFEQVVELCVKANLVWGKELYFDGSKIQANAAIDGLVDRATWNAEQHVKGLFNPELPTQKDMPPADTSNVAEPTPRGLDGLVQKYDGTRRNAKRNSSYERTTDSQVSPSDPAATPMCRFPGDHAQLGYHLHYVVDGGKARVILAALVTPASVMDNLPMLDLERWACTRWQVKPEIAVGDTKYGTIENIVGLEKDGIRAFVPMTDFSKRNEFYSAEQFQYDAARDVYQCPQGQELSRYARRSREEVVLYRAPPKVCNRCPVKAQCTASESGRHIFRSFFQAEVDRVRGYAQTEEFQKALRK
jgi:transposase